MSSAAAQRLVDRIAGDSAGAVFSRCRHYRYLLWRRWDQGALMLYIGLNPSTADARRTDPTIRRVIGFSRDAGFAGVLVVNLFAWRATDPTDLLRAEAPEGPRNHHWIRQAKSVCDLHLAGWGNHGRHRGASDAFRRHHPRLSCLAVTATGEPAHPLYLNKTLRPRPYWPPERASAA